MVVQPVGQLSLISSPVKRIPILIILGFLLFGGMVLTQPATAQARFNGSIQPYLTKYEGTIAVDQAGNLFVGDCTQRLLHEYNPSTGINKDLNLFGLDCPWKLAVDSHSNVWALTIDGKVREFLAQNNYAAYMDLSQTIGLVPSGIAVDGNGDLFASSLLGKTVTEIVAVNGQIGSTSQVNTWHNSAWFGGVTGIAVDKFGNIFVADPDNFRVQELKAVGGSVPVTAPTVATVGTSDVYPSALSIDQNGRLVIANTKDANNNTLMTLSVADGYASYTTVVKTYADNSTLSKIVSVAFDPSGNILFGDATNMQIGRFTLGAVDFGSLQINASGTPKSISFTYNGTGNPLLFAGPILVSDSTGKFSADFFDIGSGTCRSMQATNYSANTCTVDMVFKPSAFGMKTATLKITAFDGSILASASLQGVAQPAIDSLGTGLDHPSGLSSDSAGNVYVADSLDRRIVNLVGNANAVTIPSVISFGNFAFDSKGNIFYGDMLRNALLEVTAASGYTTSKTILSGLSGPRVVAIDPSDNLFVTDANRGQIKKLLASDSYATPSVIYQHQPNNFYPTGLAVDPKVGFVYVAQAGGVLQLQPPIPTAPFYNPVQTGIILQGTANIACDSNGNLLIVEHDTGKVFFYSHTNTQTTVTIATGLSNPQGIAVDQNDTVYVTDTNNGKVTRITLTTGGPIP